MATSTKVWCSLSGLTSGYGDLVRETDETTDAQFLNQSKHPDAYGQYREFLNDLGSFTGTVILK